MDAGKLKPLKLGGKVLFMETDIQRFINTLKK